MCSIVGSFSSEFLSGLVSLNLHRGSMNHSVLEVGDGVEITQGSGPLESYDKKQRISYLICHHQAPTTQSPKQHPAILGNKYLFHNGIIKQRYLEKIQADLETNETWDTLLLLMMIEKYGYECLKEIDGSFACALINCETTEVHLFRNMLSPLFVDDIYNISSTSFDDSYELPPNTVVDLYTKKTVYNFSTNDDVYFYG